MHSDENLLLSLCVTFFIKYKRIFTDCSMSSVNKNQGQFCTIMILSVLMKMNSYLLEWNYLRLVRAHLIYLQITKKSDVPSKTNALATITDLLKNFSWRDRNGQSVQLFWLNYMIWPLNGHSMNRNEKTLLILSHNSEY